MTQPQTDELGRLLRMYRTAAVRHYVQHRPGAKPDNGETPENTTARLEGARQDILSFFAEATKPT